MFLTDRLPPSGIPCRIGKVDGVDKEDQRQNTGLNQYRPQAIQFNRVSPTDLERFSTVSCKYLQLLEYFPS